MRDAYQQQLTDVMSQLVDMTSEVRTRLADATRALLDPDLAAAERVISGDDAIDAAREGVEDESFELLARQQPVAGDLRRLVASLRMAADLERMGDLAVHIAEVARLRYPALAVPTLLVPTVERMADRADHMIAAAANVVATSDVQAALALEAADDDMDDLHRKMFRILLSDSWDAGVEPAIDAALLGRYYERIGDHAVSMARRIVYLVTGQRPPTV